MWRLVPPSRRLAAVLLACLPTTEGRRMTDHSTHDCDLSWCQARPCGCPFASIAPHPRAGCRYATDVEETTTDAPR
jgi:hypothetical protein